MRIAAIFKRMVMYALVGVVGFVLGAFALYALKVRSGPPLEIWHTEDLSAVFTGENVEDVRTFDDYLRLEEKLFAQLDEQIYYHIGTGPAFALARYSTGSISDPRQWNPDWNRTFELPAKEAVGGVLLLHGMSDSPYSLRALGQTLNRHGYHVVGLRYPGHGTIPSGLKRILWEDMAAALRLAMKHLGTKVGTAPIHMVGYSTGAPLAIQYALEAPSKPAEPSPASLILISPAIAITPAAVLAKWKGWLAHLPGLEKFAWTSILPEFDPYRYNSFAINAGYQVHRLTRSVVRSVEARSASGPLEDFPPTLVFLSTVDATVSVDAVIDNLLEHLAAGRHELVLFDINRQDVAKTILVSDPGPLTARLMSKPSLPFKLSLIANENAGSGNLVKKSKKALSSEISTEPLNTAWPTGVISLSHIALPFPQDDPIYGRYPPKGSDRIFLGPIAIHGERGLLRMSSDWLVRLRHNPFYDLLERKTLAWFESAQDQ
ncbi:putative membrane protein [Olavius algarvensis associated proteobacterium Delta 3]|nr:putative membrane protein [Olavius algarvensis associated proteobacterium Delta 3]